MDGPKDTPSMDKLKYTHSIGLKYMHDIYKSTFVTTEVR